jgi:uncharacterized protein (TIGR00251 family)
MIEARAEGVVVTVWVVPGSRRDAIVGAHGDAVKIRVAAPPEGQRANRRVAELLGAATGARQVTVVAGAGSRRKRFLLTGCQAGSVARALGVDGWSG